MEMEEEKAPMNYNEMKVEQGAINNRLLELVDKQLLMVAREQSRLFLAIMFLALTMILGTAWTTWRLSIMEARLADLVETTQSMLDANDVKMDQVKKNMWELKTALNLKFSQERSAEK